MSQKRTIFPRKYAENRARFRTAYETLFYDVWPDFVRSELRRAGVVLPTAEERRGLGG